MNVLNIKKSNDYIRKLILNNENFSIIRLGIGSETYITFEYIHTNNINIRYLHPKLLTLYNAGIYTRNKDLKLIELFCKFYNRAIRNSNCLACFNSNSVNNIQNWFSHEYSLKKINSRSLEPFYAILENEIPWTHSLKNKKVLIIHPFIESFKKQLNNNFQIFKHQTIFLPEQQFIFYKPYQTIAGNHIHQNWFETFNLMCNDIKKLDFDIALLGCGGYGLPLCNFIKTKLNKSAIYIGGGLQLLFGIMGKRWENIALWKKIIKENNTKFIKSSENEKCKNLNTIEGGCYW